MGRVPNKVLILGSGGLSIGQAGEFDYSGEKLNICIILYGKGHRCELKIKGRLVYHVYAITDNF